MPVPRSAARLVCTALLCVLSLNAVAGVADAGRFRIGQQVVVATGSQAGVNVRYGSGLSYAIQRVLPNGTRVTIKGGPRYANGYEWFDITGFGNSGWAVSSGLQPAPATPLPVPVAPPPASDNSFLGTRPAAPLPTPAAPAAAGRADVRIMNVSYSSTTVTSADVLEVSVVLENRGSLPARTAGWAPGTTHHLFDVASQAPRGTWRISFECGGLSAPYDHAIRYGLGTTLPPGELRTIRMRLLADFTTPAYKSCAVGLVEEWVAWRADHVAPTFLRFGGGSAGDPVQEFFSANQVANGMLFAANGFRIEDREFWQRNPALATALAGANVLPVGKLLSTGVRFILRDSRELLVDASGHVVASRGITGARAIVGETNALTVASRYERFQPLVDFGVHNVNANGPDQLGRVASRFTVLEAKAYCCERFTLSDLGEQLTTTWMRSNTSYAKSAAAEFTRSIADGTVYRILVVTRRDGAAHGIADEVLTRADVAYEVSESGAVLHRYVR